MGTMFGSVEDYGEMFRDTVSQTRDPSPSSENHIGNPVVYKLVRVMFTKCVILKSYGKHDVCATSFFSLFFSIVSEAGHVNHTIRLHKMGD